MSRCLKSMYLHSKIQHSDHPSDSKCVFSHSLSLSYNKGLLSIAKAACSFTTQRHENEMLYKGRHACSHVYATWPELLQNSKAGSQALAVPTELNKAQLFVTSRRWGRVVHSYPSLFTCFRCHKQTIQAANRTTPRNYLGWLPKAT